MMKRLFVAVLTMFSCVLVSRAQQFNGGLMAGIVASQVAGDTYSGFNKAGLFFGGYARWDHRQGRSMIQAEMTYFQKGSRHNADPKKPDDDTYIFRANYIEVPVLYQYKFAKRFKLEAGPSMGVLINYHEERNDYLVLHNPPAALTLQVNLGLYFSLSERFRVNLRTNNSILNIRSESATGDVKRIFDYGQYHDSLVLSLFYQFKDDKR